MRIQFFYGLLLSSVILLTGCNTITTAPESSSVTATADRIQELLSKANNHSSPERDQFLLEAVDLLIDEKQIEHARQIIAEIQSETLPLVQLAQYSVGQSRIDIYDGNYELALQRLETPRLASQLDTLAMDVQLKIGLLRARIYGLLGSHVASAQQRIYIDPLLPPKQQASNRRALWRSLMFLTVEEIDHYLPNAVSDDYRGWLLLARIAKDNQGDLDQQIEQLDRWQQQWPSHPASNSLPSDLALIRQLADTRPQQIALMLPFTGRLGPIGKAVRDGFIAALYQTRQQGGNVPKINFYDTASSDDFNALYRKAVEEGAQMVIGPLEKSEVEQLFDWVSLPVPTLALNRIDHYGEPATNLYQFGLAPQDEAAQIASIANAENHHRALVLTSQDEWGAKVGAAFNEQWQALGGETIDISWFSNQGDYAKAVTSSLLLDQSEARARRIQSLSDEHIEYNPRRRQDVDMILLLAKPQQARSIKPLLAYHYAGDIQTYSTSRIYTGQPDPEKDRDINGVKFTEMPWLLNPGDPLYKSLSKELKNNEPYQRMVALGIDAFQLHPRLLQLQQLPNSRVYGKTGALSLNQQNEVQRQLLMAQISNGRAKQINIADSNNEMTNNTKEEENDYARRQLPAQQRNAGRENGSKLAGPKRTDTTDPELSL